MLPDIVIREGCGAVDWERVTAWLAETYWSPGIARAQVEHAARHSALVLSAFAADGRQIGYARVVSDCWRFAYLSDVVVDPTARGGGVGRALVRHALDHPDFATITVWSLQTKDAHGVYTQLGFTPVAEQPTVQARWMVLRRGQSWDQAAAPAPAGTAAELMWRPATLDDCGLLAELNHQLIQDEGHRNPMGVVALEQRLRAWLAGEYRAVLFESDGAVVAYALYREQSDEIYLRQLYVVRERRREGLGRAAVGLLRAQVWPRGRRLTVEVLTSNVTGVAFWRAVGYRDYSLALEILPDA